MNTKQPEAFALAQKLENAPAWESQSPTIHGWNDSGKTLADAAAELRRLHSDYETLRVFFAEIVNELHHKLLSARQKLDAAQQETASLQAQLESADDRLQDMLLADDGQADKEARKYLERRAQPTAQAQHPDDAAVEKLAEAMKQKLAEKRALFRGRGTDCTQQRLSDLLRQHVEKGDVLAVASFCAFLFARGERVSAAQVKSANEMTAKRVIGAFSN